VLTVSKDVFLFFKKTFFAESSLQLRSAKLGTPELGKFVPRVAESNPGALGKEPFADAPLGKAVTFMFFPH
jgi:hypothetical protein